MRNNITSIVVLLLLVFAPGCENNAGHGPAAKQASNPDRRGDGPYTIITTTAMIADVVRNVAGEHAQVRSLMGPGVDPHIYRPTRGDMNALLNADLIFYNGLNLEGRMSDAFVQIARAGRPVFAVTELLDEEYLLDAEDYEGYHDPHVWMDPRGWMKATEIIIEKLAEFDPSNADAYRANGKRYLAELRRLDDYARAAIATIPPERRVLVTAHDAFNYFARAYELEVRGIQGISTDSQAGVRQIEELVNLLVTRRVPAVFTESSVSEKNVRALVEGAKARGHEVRIGGELFSDAMGAEGTYEGTYIGMIDHNVTTIVRALGGEAPQRGLNGRLNADQRHSTQIHRRGAENAEVMEKQEHDLQTHPSSALSASLR